MALVANLPLDGDVLDDAGANDGTVTGITTYTTGPKNAQSFDFDGATNIALNGDTEANFDFDRNDPHTIMCWLLRNNDTAGSYFIWSKGGVAVGGEDHYQMQFTDATGPAGEFRPRFRMAQDNTNKLLVEPTNDILGPLNTWYHFACSYDGSRTARGVKFYINGTRLSNDTPISDNLLDTTVLNNDDFLIGSQAVLQLPWEGQVADFRVYDTELTQNEIIALSKLSNKIADLPLQDDTQDIVGTNHGTVTGTTTFTSGPKNTQSFDFNGSSYVTLANEGNFDMTETQAFSISFWMKGDAVSTDGLVTKQNTSGTTGYSIILEASKILFRIYDGAVRDVRSTIGSITANTWHHVVCTKSTVANETGMSIYVDGVKDDDATSNAIGTMTNNESLTLGMFGNGISNPFTGQLSEIKIWQGELTAQEIHILYNESSLNILYQIEALGAVRITPALSNFEFARKISVNMK